MSMTDAKQEFWGDLQRDFYVDNSAYFLANRTLEELIGTSGSKAHKPMLSQPQVGTYTAHSDITFRAKSATKQTLEVDTFKYAADDIDDTESMQSPYDLPAHSSKAIRNGLLNQVEQKFLSEITNAGHTISGGVQELTSVNVLDFIQEADGTLGAFDAPMDSAMKAAVFGPKTVATLRRSKADRESRLGDQVMENGVVGTWMGWTIVQNNNLPWSATLTMDTNPTDGDTLTISGVVFEYQDDLADVTAGNVGVLRHAATVATSRANLAACINNSGTEGTTYTAMDARQDFLIRRKRVMAATSAEAMAFTGYGDISVSENFTAATNVWSAQEQKSVFMVRGAIDLIVQMFELEMLRKEKGFADLVKGMVGIGTKVFDDGADMMVQLRQDASNF